MILTREEIRQKIKNKELSFEPNLDGFQLQPHAVDLRLGNVFYLPRTWEINKKGRVALYVDPITPTSLENYEEIVLKNGQYFEVLPGEYVVGRTLEKISLNSSNLMGVLYPRSSINRRGLSIGMTGIIDAYYSGYLMVPIMNMTANQVIRIYPGERVCQVVLQFLNAPLSYDEAQMHGLAKAKYHDNTQKTIAGKTDKKAEMNLIRGGKIKELKKIFKVK